MKKEKVQIAQLIFSLPDVFLLNKLANDLDIETLQWMDKWKRKIKFISRMATEMLNRTDFQTAFMPRIKKSYGAR